MIDKKLIKILKNIAVLLEIKGENPFKSRAYSNAAEIIQSENIDIHKEVSEGSIGNIKGFGEALQKKFTEYVQTGIMTYYENLITEVPVGLVELTKIANIGPKKAKIIYEILGISNLDELEIACLKDKIKELKGFTEKSQEEILVSISHKKAAKGKFLQQNAVTEANFIKEMLENSDAVSKVEFSASYRRFDETINEIGLLVAFNENVMDTKQKEIIDHFSSKSLDIPLKITFSNKKDFYWDLHQSTGSEFYIEAFNNHCIENNFQLINNKILKNGNQVIFNSEEEIYSELGLQFVPPELRENPDTVIKAKKNEIPNLIKSEDLKGVLHVHSTWSDGRNTLLQMALKAKELGFKYIAFCDHSQSAAYAGGLTPERVKKQHEEIDKLNLEDIGIRIFKGIESDILMDGSLDYNSDTLESFDLVVASIHSGFKISKSEMTKRIVKAIRNPYTRIIGHPTGRLLLARPAYEVDVKELIDVAVSEGKIIEINANPYRLDLSWDNVIYAKEKGMKTAINPDSHEVGTIEDIFLGLKVARKGWLTKDDVINCLDTNEFIKYFSIH